MKIGIVANITKESVMEVVATFIRKLRENKIDYLLTHSLNETEGKVKIEIDDDFIVDDSDLYEQSDLIISFGGDGTMLATAFNAQKYEKPVLGINLGKLGFLVEADVSNLDVVIDTIKNKKFTIEERMIIEGNCSDYKCEKMIAINDLVIDKGGWPKMIELTVWVEGEYVTTFTADGLIAATPTGSTGYSISVGGPIVSPQTDVITLSPISPHSLTIRPIVLPSKSEIIIKADSLHRDIKVNCDGQRSYSFPPPMEIIIRKSDKSLKLVHTSLTTYFQTLRTKLLWGIDTRYSNKGNKK
ncbi:MAG: NAD(+)/NADH kinase [Ignavibacterium album]|uniref:NAD(+)/NADH kinase n=1 Tax=Ignavibacterium album TaxID=591197 RepID=UPI0026EBA2CA|nr:NAD(+)/NADH kinase [Ignavibacterium album]MCX8105230.1 NAD(+)/NADH kinase [Ignavibacterium album]